MLRIFRVCVRVRVWVRVCVRVCVYHDHFSKRIRSVKLIAQLIAFWYFRNDTLAYIREQVTDVWCCHFVYLATRRSRPIMWNVIPKSVRKSCRSQRRKNLEAKNIDGNLLNASPIKINRKSNAIYKFFRFTIHFPTLVSTYFFKQKINIFYQLAAISLPTFKYFNTVSAWKRYVN